MKRGRCDVCAELGKEILSLISSEARGVLPAYCNNNVCVDCLRPGFLNHAVVTKEEKMQMIKNCGEIDAYNTE